MVLSLVASLLPSLATRGRCLHADRQSLSTAELESSQSHALLHAWDSFMGCTAWVHNPCWDGNTWLGACLAQNHWVGWGSALCYSLPWALSHGPGR